MTGRISRDELLAPYTPNLVNLPQSTYFCVGAIGNMHISIETLVLQFHGWHGVDWYKEQKYSSSHSYEQAHDYTQK